MSRLERLDPRRHRRHRVSSAWCDWHVNGVAASSAWTPAARAALLRRGGIEVGSTQVESGCFFFSDQVRFGAHGWVNHRCYFDTRDWITVGDRVAFGMEVMLCTSGHAPGDRRRRAGVYTTGPIVIGDGCWLGVRAIVLPGVTIADGCVIAAGAVVNADCEPHGVYAGVPARRIRELD